MARTGHEPVRRLSVSFSGGETSAYMTWWVLNHWRNIYDEIDVVFANTGQEHEKTLEFVHRCDEHFGFNTTWIEADIPQQRGVGPRHRVTDYLSADRAGTVFEQCIRKYGVSNKSWPKCTTMLKERPMLDYRRSLGWKTGTYDTAIGIRNDEVDRVSAQAQKLRLVYPLVSDHPKTKIEINEWWKQQPFRLELESWKGNCVWCWKKSLRKHMVNIKENPTWYDFPERMEREYGRVGPEFSKRPEAESRVFFRENRSVADLRKLAREWNGPPPNDSNEFDPVLDVGQGCEESCEVFSTDSLDPEVEEILS